MVDVGVKKSRAYNRGRAVPDPVPYICSPALVAVLLVIAAIGNLAGFLFFFDVVWSYDKFMHLYTSFAIGLALALVLRASLIARLRPHPRLIVATIAAMGMGLGVLWELAEWVVDIRGYPTVIKGKSDTMLDLIADGIGALLAGFVAAYRAGRSP